MIVCRINGARTEIRATEENRSEMREIEEELPEPALRISQAVI
jgi:hypothetical protein